MNSPFDEAKYAALLEGLEATEIPFSQLVNDNRAFRIDSYYFLRAALLAEKRLKQKEWKSLKDAALEIESFGAYALTNSYEYQEEGIPFLRCLNIKKGIANFNDVLHITPEAHQLLSKSEVKPEMVLLTMSGSVGNATVALPEWDYPINSNQDIAKITANAEFSPYFLTAFLTGSYGQIQMQRLPVGSVQQHIFLWMIGEIVVPHLSDAFQKAVEAVMKNAYATADSEKDRYAQAETLLLRALQLEDWQVPVTNNYTVSSSSVWDAARFDSEHFHPRYDDLRKRLQVFEGSVPLGELCPDPVNGVEVREYEEQGVPYLRVGDVRNFSVDLETVKRISPANAKREIEKVRLVVGDLLVSRSGSLGVIGVVQPRWKDAVISSHLIRVRIEDAEFDPYFVACFLGSRIGKMQIEKWSNGGVQPEINQSALKSLFIPKLPMTQQLEIRASIQGAYKHQRRAKSLLERAKRAVEVAIEQDEAAGLRILEEV